MKTTFSSLFLSLLFFCHGFSQAQVFEQKPFNIISGEESGLSRPEGIAFTPDGKYIAVANSDGSSIVFYEFGRSNIPVFELKGPETLLYYPHDVSFSPDGKYLAVANRLGNMVTIYKRNENEFTFSLRPIHVIKEASFSGVGAVAYSPTENILAIGDTFSNRVLIYTFNAEEYQKTPCCSIGVSLVDGLNFSPDGKFLGATSHGTHSVLFFEHRSKRGNLFTTEPVHIIKGEDSFLKYPHSLCFHPTKDYIAISSAGGSADVNFYQNEKPDQCSHIGTPVQTLKLMLEDVRDAIERENPQECGGKGVAFSPDGKTLGVCLPSIIGEDAVLFFREK